MHTKKYSSQRNHNMDCVCRKALTCLVTSGPYVAPCLLTELSLPTLQFSHLCTHYMPASCTPY